MNTQQKIDYLYGRSVRLLDELNNNDQDRIQAETKIKTMTTVDRAYEIMNHIEYLLDVRNIEYDEPAEFVFEKYL